jgi:hypothetical protein
MDVEVFVTAVYKIISLDVGNLLIKYISIAFNSRHTDFKHNLGAMNIYSFIMLDGVSVVRDTACGRLFMLS